MDAQVKIGIFGAFRGLSYARILAEMDGVTVTAVCDCDAKRREEAAQAFPAAALFADFDEFLDSGRFDAVVVCNYFSEHAPCAIRALQRGVHVLCETTAAVSPAEAVRLVEAAEESGAVYMLAENYPFMLGCQELRRVYQQGRLGRVIYGEGEYIHPMDLQEFLFYAPTADHWRRHIPRTYYLTHSLAPLMYMTGRAPRKVNARAVFDPAHAEGRGCKVGDSAAILLLENDDGSVFRITGWAEFGPHGNWYRLACANGGAETVRGDEECVRVAYNKGHVPEGQEPSRTYRAQWASDGDLASKAGHGGGDFWVCHHFVRAVRGQETPYFDVYRSAQMAAVAYYGWQSVLHDGATYPIPDFRDKSARAALLRDDLTPFPAPDGTPGNLPCSSKEYGA